MMRWSDVSRWAYFEKPDLREGCVLRETLTFCHSGLDWAGPLLDTLKSNVSDLDLRSSGNDNSWIMMKKCWRHDAGPSRDWERMPLSVCGEGRGKRKI
jgi:hypothetical protein